MILRLVCGLFVFVFLVSSVEADSKRLTIDSFTADIDTIGVVVSQPAPPATSKFVSTLDNVIGGERDIIHSAVISGAGEVTSLSIEDSKMSIITPIHVESLTVLQYDGLDASENLDTEIGLGRIDLTENGALAFRSVVHAHSQTPYTITVYDPYGGISTGAGNIQKSSSFVSADLLFSDFEGDADFGIVTAIEISYIGLGAFDFSVQTIATITLTGVSSSPSRTVAAFPPSQSSAVEEPSPSASASASESVTPHPSFAPSSTSTGTASPSPTPQESHPYDSGVSDDSSNGSDSTCTCTDNSSSVWLYIGIALTIFNICFFAAVVFGGIVFLKMKQKASFSALEQDFADL